MSLPVCLLRPHSIERPESASHRFSDTGVGITQSPSDGLVNEVQTATVFDSALLMSLAIDQGSQPACRIEAQLQILFLGGPVDMLKDTDVEGHIPNDRVDRSISVLSSNLFQRSTQLHQVLHYNLNHGVDLWPAGSSKILDQKAAIGAERGSERVHNLEEPIKE